MIASSSSRNSSKNMPRFSSNGMVHNHYLDVAKKKIQERDRNSTTSVTTFARFQSTADYNQTQNLGATIKPSRSLPVSKSTHVTITAVPKSDHSKSSSSFSDSKNFVCSTCHKCVFNANHDACITKLLKEIFTGHRFSPNKTSDVYEKTSHRSDLRWKPTGRIFQIVVIRWIPTESYSDSAQARFDSEPHIGSNVDIPNIHECKQTLDSMVAEKDDISETIVKVDSQMMIQKNDHDHNKAKPRNLNGKMTLTKRSTLAPTVSKEVINQLRQFFRCHTTDASNKRQQQPDSTSSTSTLATTVTANGNFDL
ncbi:hypothetical protein Tco_0349433 [Tanacetum coccineum]